MMHCWLRGRRHAFIASHLTPGYVWRRCQRCGRISVIPTQRVAVELYIQDHVRLVTLRRSVRIATREGLLVGFVMRRGRYAVLRLDDGDTVERPVKSSAWIRVNGVLEYHE